MNENEHNESLARLYLDVIGENLSFLKEKWAHQLKKINQEDFEDKLQDTILKVYEKILCKGIKDSSTSGFINYTFRALSINLLREKEYARNASRDLNISSEELNKQDDSNELQLKIKRELLNDWLVIRLLQIVEKNFDELSFRCFRLYYLLPKMTYIKLKEITKIPDSKKRVVEIKKWLITNVDKKKLIKEFEREINYVI